MSSFMEKGSVAGWRPQARRPPSFSGVVGTLSALPSWVSRPSKMGVWMISGS